MSKSLENIDELIGKYLAGEAGVEETDFIESWAKEDESNQKYIDQFKTIFQKTASVKELQSFDTDAAWIRIKGSLKKTERGSINFDRGKSSSMQLMWRIAASVLIVLGVGFAAYNIVSERPQLVEVVATRQTVTDTLPDGSGVVLNRETKLAYQFDEKKKVHTVTLRGEAYFNIHHDEDKTFIVDIAGVYIRDIGTAFNVKAYPESNTVEVVVEQGEVMFYTDEDSGVYLRENGKGIYDKTTKKFTIDQPEENVMAYKTKLFSFNNTDLVTIVDALNGVYDKQIVLSEGLGNCHLTVSFNNESQEEIVAIIAETLGLTIEDSADKFTLEGEGCENK